MMNSIKNAVMGLTVATAALVGTGVNTAQAATTWGQVTFVGTVGQAGDSSSGYHARLRVRVRGTCDTDSVSKDRWLIISSGRTDGVYSHNAVNMKNAYATLTAAMLSGKWVQIDGLSTCSNASSVNMNLWTSQIGIY
jgi:hypothetical protein